MKRYVHHVGMMILAMLFFLGFDWGGNPDEPPQSKYVPPPIWTNGHIVFNAHGRVFIVPEDGSRLHISSADEGYALASSVSSDGLVAFTGFKDDDGFGCVSLPGGDIEIETVSLDGADRRPFSKRRYEDAIDDGIPQWSPDGSQLAFPGYATGKIDGKSSLHILHRDNADSGRTTRISLPNVDDKAILDLPPAWSPDGTRIAFMGTGGIHIADVDSGESVRIGVGSSSTPAWSPDGNRLAFVGLDSGLGTRLRLYTVRSDGSDIREVASLHKLFPDSDYWRLPLSWGRDGSEIRIHNDPFVVVNADGSNMRVMDVMGEQTPCNATHTTCPFKSPQVAWSPDDSRMVVLLHDNPTGVLLFTMESDGTDRRVLVRRGETSNDEWEAVQDGPEPDTQLEWTYVER